MKRFILPIFFLLAIPFSVFAGTIDSTNKYARFLGSGTLINFGTTNGNVAVNDATLTGYAWGADAGWINLSPANGGVANNGNGVLSGYAWGEHTGWINFNPANGGVTIDATGNFNGYAWSQTRGWIVFNCATDSTCGTLSHKVQTNWIPITARVQCNNLTDDDSDGLIDYPADTGCSSSIDTDETNSGGGGGGGGPPPPPPPPSDTVLPPPPPPPPDTVLPPPSDTVLPPPPPPPPDTVLPPPPPPPSDTVLPPISISAPSTGSGVVAVISSAVETFSNQIINTVSSVTANVAEFFAVSIPDIAETVAKATVQTKKAVGQVRQETKAVLGTPAGEITNKTVTMVGVVTGGTTAFIPLFFTQLFSLKDLLFLPVQLWGILLSALGIKRRHRPWGAVYDSVTKQPLDPAYVKLQTLDGKEVATAFTDLDGRYGFFAPPGTYRLVVNKTNYKFPSERLLGKTKDEFYGNLYFGETIVLSEGDVFLARDIPMDPKGFDWNEYAKRAQHLMGFYSRNTIIIERLSRVLFAMGFLLTLFVLFADPQPYSIAIGVLYAFVWLLRKVGPGNRPHGVVIEKGTGLPVAFGVVKVLSPDGKIEVRKSITDVLGRYYCLVTKGAYNVGVMRKEQDGSYSSADFSKDVQAPSGIIREKFEV